MKTQRNPISIHITEKSSIGDIENAQHELSKRYDQLANKVFGPVNKQTEIEDDIAEAKRSINYLRARLADEFVAGNETAAIETADTILVYKKAIIDAQSRLYDLRRKNFNEMKERVLHNIPVML